MNKNKMKPAIGTVSPSLEIGAQSVSKIDTTTQVNKNVFRFRSGKACILRAALKSVPHLSIR